MTASTITGSGNLHTLLVSSGANLAMPHLQYVSLFQGATATITGSGTSVLFLGRVESNSNGQLGVEVHIDGQPVLTGSAGDQLIFRAVLSAGSHTIEFLAFALANELTADVFGLTIIDLGL